VGPIEIAVGQQKKQVVQQAQTRFEGLRFIRY
jgi:hypothetical protein